MYKYNDKGLVVEETKYNNPGRNPSHKYMYKYNDKGLKIEETYEYEGKLSGKYVYKYNDKDLKIEETFTNNFHSEILIGKIVYKYNDKDLLIEKTYYDKLGEPNYRTVYEYNKSEKEIVKGYTEIKVYEYKYKSSELDSESKNLSHHYTHDKNGNIVTICGKDYKFVYKYNDKGYLIEQQYFSDEELQHITKYKNNDKGLRIEETKYDKQGEPKIKLVYEWM